MKTLNKSTLAIAVAVASLASANAAVVFTDDFESPDLDAGGPLTYSLTGTSATSRTASSDWVRSTAGYGASSNGLIDAAYEGFTAPGGNQAYGFRYSNSGVTTSFGTIGALTAGTIITVSFDVFDDGTNGGSTPLSAALATFDGAGTRNDTDGGGGLLQNTSSYLGAVSGSAPASGFSTWQIIYTVGDDVLDADGAGAGTATTFDTGVLGDDIALRFQGATNSASIDNVSIDISVVPEPSTTALLGLGGLALILRRRK
ncbi:MAG: PEP-CTERM sorting domain-containing protein [Verrucomicrobiae bacterium]|nr:PEP-CTERM sorting domain-containing protein [Verrucomicrobiae bacterium]NNJ43874.1 PEP-CTERM sorting domain-containing protein [Akkermansiaceae bacterium]